MMLDFSNKVKDYENEPHFITKQSLWKFCEEYTVMATLIHFFPDKYLNLVHSDKPDLVIENLIGIEVTQCLGEAYNKSIGEWTNYRLGKQGKTYERCVRKIAEQGGKLDSLGLTHTMDENSEFVPIVEAIDKKTAKLKEYRSRFNECSLAIILEQPIDVIPYKAINYFESKQLKSDVKFDSLIIVASNELYIYEYKTKLITKRSITRNEQICLGNIGVLLANNIVSSIKECFVSPSKQAELDCIEEVKKAIFNQSNYKIVRNNGNLDKIREIIWGAKPSDNCSRFPDFVFKGGLIEHFIVSSSKENRKGSAYKIHENITNKETHDFFKQKDLEFINSERKPNTIMTYSKEDVFTESSYTDFIVSFKRHFDSHYNSLMRSNFDNTVVIFLIDQQGGSLGIYENNVFARFYALSDDRNLLYYLENKYPNVNYVIFKSVDSLEIIDLSKINDLIKDSKDGLDIRGGRMVHSTIKFYVDQ